MASESNARSSDPAAAAKVDPQTEPASARGPEGPASTTRDAMSTLPDIEEGGTFDFEAHDTIPAPPWLGEADDVEAEPASKRSAG